MVTGNLACKGMDKCRTNKENPAIFCRRLDFVLFYRLHGTIYSEYFYLCASF